jgi:hypothetical protein
MDEEGMRAGLVAFRARRTRTMKRCSFDARSRRRTTPALQEEKEEMREGRLPRCSRNARPEKDGEEAARCPSCSQSPHDEAVVARCAQ